MLKADFYSSLFNMLRTLQSYLALFILLCGIYLLVYKGAPISDDELMLLSSTDAVVREQDLALYSMFNRDDNLQRSAHEPLQAILAAPLFWMAQHVDGVGIVHVVWLFNLLVVTATCVLLYGGGLSLGYGHLQSWLTALITGTATILLPYTQNFFREPLAGFWTLLALLLAHHFYARRTVVLGVGLLLACTAAFLTKITVFAALLPTLLLILFPAIQTLSDYRRAVKTLVIGGIVVLSLLILARLILPDNSRFNLVFYDERLRDFSIDYFLIVVKAYLLSPGRSIWAGSPILLLSLYGAWLSYRQKRYRFAFAPLLLLLTITLIYGFGARDWHGGRGWGTRYLVPVVPAMSLLLLPVAEKLFRRSASRIAQLAAAGLLAFSMLVQIGGAMMPIDLFYYQMGLIFQENALPAFYDQGTWQVQYTPWFLHLRYFTLYISDVAWNTVAEPGWHIWLAALLMIGTSFALIWNNRHPDTPRHLLVKSGIAIFLLTGSFGVALHSIYYDPRLQGTAPALFELVEALETREGNDDIIYLANPAYQKFFMNYYKGPNIWVTLPVAAGERFSEGPIPGYRSVIVEEQLSIASLKILKYGVDHYESVWLIENQGQYHPWSFRPAEHWLTKHTYPIASVEIQPDVRLIGFYSQNAPAWIVEYGEIYGDYEYRLTVSLPFTISCTFDNSLYLANVRFSESAVSGNVLPVSLNWIPTDNIPVDYHVALFLLKSDGFPVASRNSPPQNGFGDMRDWFASDEPSQIDNHGLIVPEQTPSGTYALGLVVYDWRNAKRVDVTCEQNEVVDNMVIIGNIVIK